MKLKYDVPCMYHEGVVKSFCQKKKGLMVNKILQILGGYPFFLFAFNPCVVEKKKGLVKTPFIKSHFVGLLFLSKSILVKS
jgi:hypothetical protein